jgi:hypothetical protein
MNHFIKAETVVDLNDIVNHIVACIVRDDKLTSTEAYDLETGLENAIDVHIEAYTDLVRGGVEFFATPQRAKHILENLLGYHPKDHLTKALRGVVSYVERFDADGINWIKLT